MLQIKPLRLLILENMYSMVEERQSVLEHLLQEYQQTLDVLGKVVSGEIDRSRVIVSQDGWQLLPEEPEDE